MERAFVVGAGAAILLACAPAAPPTPPDRTVLLASAPAPSAKACPERLSRATTRIDHLLDAGRLDDASRATREDPAGCAELGGYLDGARLQILRQIGDGTALLALARRLSADPSATPQIQQLAREILAAPPPSIDALDLAERSLDQARQASSDEERRAHLDTALLALERATGAAPQVIALAGYRPQLIDETSLVAEARSEPDGRSWAVALRLDPLEQARGQARARPFRLLGSGAQTPDLSVGKSGSVVVHYKEGARVYPTLRGEARALPDGARHDVARDAVVIGNERSVEIVTASAGDVVIPKTSVTLTRAALDAARKTQDERFWIACGVAGEDASGVVVVDLQEKRVTVNLPRASGCAVDPARSQLVVLQPPDAATPSPFVEVIPLDGSASTRLALPKGTARGAPRLTYDATRGVAQVGVDPSVFLDLERRRVLSAPPRARPVGPPALRSVPVGHAGGDRASVAPLAALARPPRRIIEPSFVSVHTWMENGLKSFDGATVAAFTAAPTGEGLPVELVIADAATLKVRHTIDVGYGINWLTAYFLDNRSLVVQSYPAYDLYDAVTGELLASADLGDCPDAAPRLGYFLCGARLWAVAPDPGKHLKDRRVDLGFSDGASWKGKAPERELERRSDEVGSLRFTAEGKVVLRDLDPPSWLHCRFGDRLAPFAVCQHRLQEGASEAPSSRR